MKKEKDFKPQPGQVDYTNIRWAPVVNCVVRCDDKILLLQRNKGMKMYPEFWNGVSGFLDDDKNLNEKVKEELREEVGIEKESIVSIKLGKIFDQDEPQYKKTWIVHPVLVDVKDVKIKLDWESQSYKWVSVDQARKIKLLPGFDLVLDALF